MMVIISDTSPLQYLVLIEQIHILHALYGRVIIPRKVFDELQQSKTPGSVKAVVSCIPPWLEIRSISTPIDLALSELDPGEQEAITLALELHADALLIDDHDGRNAARLRGLRVVGTLGILYDAAERGLCDLGQTFEKLQQTNFRASAKLYRYFLNLQAAQHKRI